MGERLLCKQEVVGSIPITSTTARTMRSIVRREVRQRRPCAARARGRRGARGRRWTDGRLIDREKQFAQGCELVGV